MTSEERMLFNDVRVGVLFMTFFAMTSNIFLGLILWRIW
jgi:hypothetical protein